MVYDICISNRLLLTLLSFNLRLVPYKEDFTITLWKLKESQTDVSGVREKLKANNQEVPGK